MTANRFTFAAAVAVIATAIGVFGGIEISKRAVRAARIAAEPWRQSPDWKGTTLAPKVSTPQRVVAAFENDPPAPEGRKAIFAEFLPGKKQPGSIIAGRKFRCVGWYGSLDSVTPNADGWEVLVTIGCHLKGGGVPFCPSVSKETWQVSKSGTARCVKSDSGPLASIVMVD